VLHAVQDRPLPEPSDQRLALSAHRNHIERWLKHDELKRNPSATGVFQVG
jgi:hypothetical protein